MRRKLDAYFTPEWAVDELLTHTNISGVVLEPCAGNGVFIPKIRTKQWVTEIVANDINPAAPVTMHKDARTFKFDRFDWAITNPPFRYAFDILKNLYNQAEIGVAFLLRLSFLEPTYERGEWLSEHPPTRIIILPRISFTGNRKTDSVTCAWMVWNKFVELERPYGDINIIKK